MIKHITADEVKRMTDTEGLILQGYGNPQDWLDGINRALIARGTLLEGDKVQAVGVFEHNGLINMLFRMEDVNVLSAWRLESHDELKGIWLSDFLSDTFGINKDRAASVEDAPPIWDMGERPSPYRDGFYSDGPHPDDREIFEALHPLQVYIENAGNQPLGGFTMPLPATLANLQPFLDGIEIKDHRDIKIWEVTSEIESLGDVIITDAMNKSMSPDTLNELNYLSAIIADMHPEAFELFAAAVEAKRHCSSIAGLINITENIGCFDLQPAFIPEQYGEFLLEARKDSTAEVFRRLEQSENPDERAFTKHILQIEAHIDLAALGRSAAEEENGVFTALGYLTENKDENLYSKTFQQRSKMRNHDHVFSGNGKDFIIFR